MSAAMIMERIAEASPRVKARIAGVFYLLTFLTGGVALFVRGGLGFAAGLIVGACYIAVTLLFYYMFKPVQRSLSLLAAFFSLVGCAIGPLGLFVHAASHISPLVLFGFYCLLIGYLIFKSTFSNSGRLDGDRRFGLANLSVHAARTLSVPLQSGPRHPRGRSADPVAPGGRCERTAMEASAAGEWQS
jgi:Domain of unknown function (DUF4386)